MSRPGERERSEGSRRGWVLDRSESEREMERASCRSPLLFWRCQRQKRRFDRSVERPFERSPCAAAAASGAPLQSGSTATGRRPESLTERPRSVNPTTYVSLSLLPSVSESIAMPHHSSSSLLQSHCWTPLLVWGCNTCSICTSPFRASLASPRSVSVSADCSVEVMRDAGAGGDEDVNRAD